MTTHVKGLRQFWGEFSGFDANPATGDQAVFDDAFKHLLGYAHGNSKPDAHAAARFGINGGVDAQQIALNIDQGTTRVAGVDGSVGLYEVFECVDAQLVAPQCRNDATGNGLSHAKGVAYGQDNIANLKLFGVVQNHHG